MPGILMEGQLDSSSPVKEIISAAGSPGAPPVQTRQINYQSDAHSWDTSINRLLHDNVHGLESSSNDSVSQQSAESDVEELANDSQLHNLVSGEMTVDVTEKDGNGTDAVGEKVDGLSNEKSKAPKSRSPCTKALPPKKSNMPPPLLLPEWNASTRTIPSKRPPSDKSVLNERRLSNGAKGVTKDKGPDSKEAKSQNGTWDSSEAGLDNPDLGPFLLKHARDLISSGVKPRNALKYAVRAAKSFELCAVGKPSLDLTMCLHVIAAIQCSLGQYGDAIPLLKRSIEIPVLEKGQDHALAKFSGYMQLGDTYAMLGQLENSIQCYASGLQVQKQTLGNKDPRVGETYRYLAEAHMQALQLNEAERFCQMALEIHQEQGSPGSLEETADRRLLGLICDTKGDYESSLEHLVLASMAMMSNGQEAEVANVDCSIGDIYLSLARYDEAVFAYQKALTVFKTTKGENHPSVASVFVRLADLYNKTGKFRESKSYCENALRIYGKPLAGTSSEEVASGLTDISAIYESMDEPEQAIKLLQKVLKMYDDARGQQSTIAGIEAQIGVLYYITGNFTESHASFKNAITKLRMCGEKKSAFFGIALNQMGLACLQLNSINEATELFEEARTILEQEYGPHHPDTIGVCSNLAGTYDAMGRMEEAIEILEHIVGLREDKLGTANPDVDDEKRRLAVLLKEAGRIRHRKSRSLEMLLDTKCHVMKKNLIAS